VQHYKTSGSKESRGYWFWIPTIGVLVAFELMGAFLDGFRDLVRWPTISSTVGHLEKLTDFTALVVVWLIAAVVFHTTVYRVQLRQHGRSFRPGRQPRPGEEPLWWYGGFFVLPVGFAVALICRLAGFSKYTYGYVLYSVLAIVVLIIPSSLAYWRAKLVRFPTLFYTVYKLRHRCYFAALILLSGLTVLTFHLALYPWPSIQPSPTFAGLNPAEARQQAKSVMTGANRKAPYSAEAHGIDDGNETWFVYFKGAGTSCTVLVSKDGSQGPDCSP
jgi:hypothetical protein